jgi:hypothetical protein
MFILISQKKFKINIIFNVYKILKYPTIVVVCKVYNANYDIVRARFKNKKDNYSRRN